MVEEVNCHLGEFVLLVGRTGDKGINQDLELLGAEGRLELERSTQERLGDGEGGKGIVFHCFQLQVVTFFWGLDLDRWPFVDGGGVVVVEEVVSVVRNYLVVSE